MGDERGSAIWGLVGGRGVEGPGEAGDVRMSLAGADDAEGARPGTEGGGDAGDHGGAGDPAGPDGDLKSSRNAWTRAGGDVDSLRGNIKTALTGLEKDQTGIGAASRTGRTASAAAQRDVYASWKRYLGDVSARCGVLKDRLHKAGTDHYANEAATKGAFDRLDDAYGDTPALGGEKGMRSDGAGHGG
ncbi:hypothetical protein [Streptomyces sp. Z26]|uniref:hypothetical protein n=1 Tax=Streptomyces sp. Z26 TaxID=2500177 RepID=UPI000EF16692|nr:hypothetical protein [Streptomyces sp. Z26]RLL67964.1 hypothetical protein D7M15_15190 [Streptomyces sp. Z26]